MSTLPCLAVSLGSQLPFPRGTAPLLLLPHIDGGDTTQAKVSNNASHPPDPAGCDQQVFLTVFGKLERLNVDRVGADKPIRKEIWSLQYHCRLNQQGMVFLASIFHLLLMLVLVCKNILIMLLQTLASKPISTQYDREQCFKLSSPGRARDIWGCRDVKIGKWLEAVLGRAG